MKNFLWMALALLCAYPASAQKCNEYFPLENGTRWVIESFNQKNKFQSKSVQTVQDTRSTDNGFEGRMKGEVIDNKNNTISQIDYELKCEGDFFYVSMNSMLSPEQMQAYQEMDIEVDGDFLELPPNMEPGMALKDAAINVKVTSSGVPIMSMTVEIYDRKVEGFEEVTTPSGTYECVKIAFSARTQMGQAIPIKINTSGAEWFAKGTGLVRSESYDKKNKLIAYSVLTEFSK